jgi:glycerol kinase
VARGKFVLAIDQGTTNTKALLVARSGEVAASASKPVEISYPTPGWVEQDPLALVESVLAAIGDCVAQVEGAEIVAIGISNQRESALVWDRKTGEPLGPCVVWQCRRTAPFCDHLRERGLEELIQASSGLPVDPLFSASKIAWLLSTTTDARRRANAGELCAGNVDGWLLWNLTGGTAHATDVSNASRTQLLGLADAQWDPALMEIFDIPRTCLPDVRPSSGIFGHTRALGALPAGIPIASLIGDSHAALFAHAAFAPGTAKATYGTGSSVMTLTGKPVASRYGLSSTIAWGIGTQVQYALEGNITNAGGAVEWLGNFLGLSDPVQDTAALAASVEDSGGVYMVPAFAGLGAPHWDADARGLIVGLTRGSTAAHAARATLESIAFQVHDVVDAMRHDAGSTLPALMADGGASRNAALMQFQADMLGCPVIRTSAADLSARGAAWLAGLATGFWSSLEELAALPRETERFEPGPGAARRMELLAGWQDALLRAASKRGLARETHGAN